MNQHGKESKGDKQITDFEPKAKSFDTSSLIAKSVEIETRKIHREFSPYRHPKAVRRVHGDRARVHIEEIVSPVHGGDRVGGETRDRIGDEPSRGGRGTDRICRVMRVNREARGLHHEVLRHEGRRGGHLRRGREREECWKMSGPSAGMFDVGRSVKTGRADPRSTRDADRITSLSNHGSSCGDCSGTRTRLLCFLTWLGPLCALEALDLILRLFVNETEMLFDVAHPLARMVAQRASGFSSLCRLSDVAFEGGELGETLLAAAGAVIGLVLTSGGMLLLQLMAGVGRRGCVAEHKGLKKRGAPPT